MGSCLSPILAELVVDTLIKTVTGKLDFQIPYIRKFVDDLIIALPEDKTQETLEAFNAYHPMLQFTLEKESQNQLPYLDTLITRNTDQTISTQWYAKPIASGRLLNFHSHHPTTMKLNVAHNFMKRVVQLTTNQTHQQCKQTIFQHLRANDYPSKLINRMLNHLKSRSTIATSKPNYQENRPPNIANQLIETATIQQQPQLSSPSATQLQHNHQPSTNSIHQNQQSSTEKQKNNIMLSPAEHQQPNHASSSSATHQQPNHQSSPENHKQNQQPSSNTANKPNHQSTLAKQQQPNHPPSTDIQQQQHNDPVSSDQHQQPYQPNPSIHQKHNDPVSSDQHQQSYQPNPSIHQQHSHQLTPVSQERQNQQTPSINQQQSSINIEPASVNTTSTITQPTQSGTSIDFSYRTLSYIPSLTAKIIRDLKKEFLNVKFAQKTINNVGKLFPIVKDPILPAQQSKIIYSIPCRDCEKVYIGMSTNTLTKRMYGHKSDVNRYEKVLTTGVTNTAEIKKKLGDTTAMTDHVINTQHRFDHNRAKIIDRAQYTSTLRVLEMCHITNTTNTVNYRTDTASLSATYTGILQSVKPKQPSINSNSINNNQNSHITTIPIPLTNSESSTSNNTHTFHITQYP